MIQKETRMSVADNSGAKVVLVIGVLRGSTARGRYTRRTVGVGDRVTCSVKKALPNAEVKTGVASSWRIAVMKSDQMVRGIRKKPIPGALMFTMVVM